MQLRSAGLFGRNWRVVVVLLVVVLGIVAAVALGEKQNQPVLSTPTAIPTGPPATPAHPNIVFVLTDDLSSDLVPYMPHVLALEKQGMTFTNYTVTDSLCCPSRASILTGDFPHDTQVLTNQAPDGGFDRFTQVGDDKSTIGTSLTAAGYRTALMGKYLNEYRPQRPVDQRGNFIARSYVPPGWSVWNGVDGGGYSEYGYVMADNQDYTYFSNRPQDYLTTVLQNRATRFITDSAAADHSFMLEVATFAPHEPYVPAPQDRGTFAGLHAPRTPAFGRRPAHALPWLRKVPPLTPASVQQIDHDFQLRVESVQAVDRMVGSLERTVADAGQAGNTVFVFSSDNGYHMGQYMLRPGKQTAFDTDIHVPLVVAGPGIAPGSTNSDVVENIDLRPTFAELAGAPPLPQADGQSLVPLLHGEHPLWRTVALIEHHHPAPRPGDPDLQSMLAGDPPTYEAIRTKTFTYVLYIDGTREYYDRTRDPYELDNIAGSLSAARVRRLDQIVIGLASCHGAAACFAAGRPPVP